VSDEVIRNLLKGVMIDEHLCRFTDIQYFAGEGVNRWYHVVLMEGRNREVRKLWESQGIRVSRLKRVRYGPIFIPSKVTRGEFYELPREEMSLLYKAVNLPMNAKPRKLAPVRR
jgi:23S rRNA pseudouridine2605 synthase